MRQPKVTTLPPPQKIRLTRFFQLAVVGPAHLAKALQHLTKAERLCLPSTALPKRVEEFALGRFAAKRALKRMNPAWGKEPLCNTKNTRAPQWPKGVYGAISHNQGWAAAVVHGGGLGVGIDLQHSRPCHRGLAKRILKPSEHAYYTSLSSEVAQAWLLTVFGVKESLYKALQPVKPGWWGFQQGLVILPSANLRHGYHYWKQHFKWTALPQADCLEQQALVHGQGCCWRKNAWCLALSWVVRSSN